MRTPWFIAAAVVLAGCTGAPTPSPTVSVGTPVPTSTSESTSPSADPTSSSRWMALQPGSTTTCESGLAYGITGSGRYTLTGECPLVSVSGDRAEVSSAGTIALLQVHGQANEVRAGAVSQVDIAGDRNDIDVTEVTLASVAGEDNELSVASVDALVITGDRNEVDGGSTIGFLTINGNENEVEAQAIENRELVGSGNRVTVK